jgi:hypothetical protein
MTGLPHPGLSKLLARSLVLDVEVAIYDQQLRSRFDWLREPDPDAVASPPLYMAFDLLYHDRRDLTEWLLRDRRARPPAAYRRPCRAARAVAPHRRGRRRLHLAAGILLLASRVDGRLLLREVVRARPAAEGLAVVLVAQGRPLLR